jgi:hypothetical protein
MSESQRKRRNIRGLPEVDIVRRRSVPSCFVLSMTDKDATAVSTDGEGKIRPGMTRRQNLDVAGPPHNADREDIREYRVRYPDRFGTYTDSLHVIFKDDRCVETAF